MDNLKIYFNSLLLQIKCQIEYKASLILSMFAQIGVFFTYYFMIIALFQKFNNIAGFNLYEVLLCFAIIHFGFAFNETFFRGLDKFEDLIINGDLDRFLVRPKNIIFQVLCQKMDIIKVFRILQSIIVLIIALLNLNINFSFLKVITIILMLISSIIIFFAIFLLMASYCFITIQGLEVKNLMTDGGKHMAQYPIGIFKKGFLFIFSYIIPYAFVNYYPLLYVIGKKSNLFFAFSPLLVVLYLIPCILLFNIGMKHYNSTGS